MADQAKSSENQSSNPAVSVPKLPSAFDLFKPSWEATKVNLVTMIALYLLWVGAGLVTFLIIAGLYNSSHALAFVLGAIGGLATVALVLVAGPGITYCKLKATEGTKVGFNQAFDVGKHFALRAFGLSLVVGLAIIGGLILLIVPGLIMIRRYYLVQYVLVDKDVSISEAMSLSAASSKPYTWAIWAVIGVQFLIQFLQIIPFVGWLATLVLYLFYYCASTLRYQQIKAVTPELAAKS